jgi:hypothetical protein
MKKSPNLTKKYLKYSLPSPFPKETVSESWWRVGYERNRQSGFSALECGHVEVRAMELLANAIFSWVCPPVAGQ